ncbi:MAG: NAD kinase [Chitinophagales bacterium]|nr:NAD kinase [Chitinophagales bacterium]MDW8419687.1 NAD kinase [Chitinophagales bacterium]
MVVIYGKNTNEKTAPHSFELLLCLTKRGITYMVEERFAQMLQPFAPSGISLPTFQRYADVVHDTDVVLSLGGDGTILDAVVMVKHYQTPILGINFGRLGFLASLGKEQIEAAVDAIERRSYLIDKRSLIELQTNKPLFEDNFALNDMTIQRQNQSSMITVNAYLNGEMLNTYWADGLIVATPTGSTGYSLSCGGPIIYPTSGNFVITPVAPHNLNVRPMVVSDEVVLSFEVTGRGNSFLCTLDTRAKAIDSTYQLAVRKASFHANIIRLTDQSFLTALKSKLNWGSDQRN